MLVATLTNRQGVPICTQAVVPVERLVEGGQGGITFLKTQQGNHRLNRMGKALNLFVGSVVPGRRTAWRRVDSIRHRWAKPDDG